MQGSAAPSPSVAAPALSRRRLALLLVGMVLVAINLRAIITIVGPLIGDIRADLDLSRSAAGLLTALPLVAFGLVSPLAPRLARRFGSDRTLVVAMLVMAAWLALRPLPPLALLFLGTLAAGCGAAIANVLLPALIKRHFPERAAFLVATYSVVLGIGAAIAAGFAVPSMDWLGGSWRAALGIWAIPALLGALAWLPQMRREPARRRSDAGPRVHVQLWRDRVAWQVTGFLAFMALLFYSMAAWLPDIYHAEGLSSASAGGLLSISLVVGLPLGLMVGVAAERLDDQRPIVLVSVAFLLVGWLGVLLAPMASPWLWVALLGCGFGIGFPLVLTLMVLRAPDVRHAAELSGMAQSAGYSVAALGPVLIGALHDLSGSWTLPLIVLVACTGPALVLGLGGGKPRFVGDGGPGGPAAGRRAAAPRIVGLDPAVLEAARSTRPDE
ncbi:MAG: CynX/NimT family MFS transporter [Conexibacter sp.]